MIILFRLFTVFLLVFAMLFLAGCGTTAKRQDGPPNFYVDETKVPNAVPKKEALSKYGNMRYYHVFGDRYYTMKSAKNYDQIGVASWYGTMYHGRRTSSGERYNMLAMTAAHKTLPLPSYVEVTNLKNNRKIIVKVNDRGPFASDRIIDLSYVAAKKLGMANKGTATVRVKVINLDTFHGQPIMLGKNKPKARSIFASRFFNKNNKKPAGPVYLTVGTYRNKSYAMRLKGRLGSLLGTPVKMTSASKTGSSNKNTFYRVQIGPIKDVATAKRITGRLQTMGISIASSANGARN